MNKMSLTKLRWYMPLCKPVFLVWIATFLIGLSSAMAQIKMELSKSGADTCTTLKFEGCNGEVNSSSVLFTDDGSNDGNYGDPDDRQDTTEICPTDKWHHVKVVFNDFDLDDGDELYAYQGNKAAVRAGIPYYQRAEGTGVAQGFGGWIDADCDPAVNESGCLTFIFYTDGDNEKGAGWEAWVDCAKRNIQIEKVNIANVDLRCEDDPYGIITIPAPLVTGCEDQVISDTVIARVRNQHGEVCIERCLSKSGLGGFDTYIRDTFAIGSYSVTFKLKSDTTKISTQVFSVQAPSLVCNDNVNIPIGSICMVAIKPDDVLEAPCDTSDFQDYMYYKLTITIKGAHGFKDVIKMTTGYNNLGRVQHPVITLDDIKDSGNDICSAEATVLVERSFYLDRDNDGHDDIPDGIECHNGAKTSSCSTILNFADQSKPWITLDIDIDTIVACDTTGLDKILNATALDNCDDNIDVTYSVEMLETDPCFIRDGVPNQTIATVTFTAIDDCGNIGIREKEFTIIRPGKEYLARTKDLQLDCSDTENTASGVPGLKVGYIKDNIFRVRDTILLSEEEYICGYILIKEDAIIPATDCGSKLYRYWSILDWCQPEIGPSVCDTTFIEYIDTIAPMFVEDVAVPLHLKLDHFSCEYDLTTVVKPEAKDNCDDNPKVRIDKILQIEDGKKLWEVDPIYYTKLWCDSFYVRWVVEDACHEQFKNDTLYQIVVVKDVTPPSAICTDKLNVSLSTAYGARVYVDDVDANSYDACGIEKREIRIKESGDDWAPYVDISCEYVHPDLQLELKVTDKKGNYNICWLDVDVEDKFPPVCTDLPDAERYCDEFHNGELGASTDADGDGEFEETEWVLLSEKLQEIYNQYFGVFDCIDNLASDKCGVLTSQEYYQLIEWPCGQIEIRRKHAEIDWSGNVSGYAYQSVKIAYRAGWKITLPDDWEGECGDSIIAPELEIINGACDLLGYEVTSRLFQIPGDACFKMERTYHIINWCRYIAGEEPKELNRVEGDHGVAEGYMLTGDYENKEVGYWTYVQVLKVHDNDAPVVTVLNPDPCINGIDFDAAPYGEEDNTYAIAPYECDEEKTWTASAMDCTDPSAMSWEGRLYDISGNLVATSNTNSITYVVTNKMSYYAEFWAFDGCGNSGGAKGDLVQFWDCRKPSPYLLNGVTVEMMETGMIQVWATDLDQASFDNCTDQKNLDFRMWHSTLGDAPTDLLGVRNLPKVIEFTCFELGIQNVHIYVIDEENNWDYALTYVNVQDNRGVCTGLEARQSMVAGTIQNDYGDKVESVTIAVNGADDKTMTTHTDGNYSFMLPTGGDYTLTPVKDKNPLNGVSTFDLVLISKHILGINTFDSPYKHIAADINKSGSITAYDMVELRQLILNISSDFPNNTSWRFVEKGYEFTTVNPAAESFNEFMSINNLSTDMYEMDFMAIKIGDVNGNAQANSLTSAEERAVNGTFNLNVLDRFVTVGERVSVDFRAEEISNTAGYQFTLDFSGLALEEVREGLAKSANFNTNLSARGLLATSWNGEGASQEVLFTLTFKATTTGLLSDLMSISSGITTAEAYNKAGELLNVDIQFEQPTSTEGFVLKQNIPNPFQEQTVIGFNLPNAGSATLKVIDLQGRALKSITAEYAKGQNTVTLNANELGAGGVLYYQLESADIITTKKMILIK